MFFGLWQNKEATGANGKPKPPEEDKVEIQEETAGLAVANKPPVVLW